MICTIFFVVLIAALIFSFYQLGKIQKDKESVMALYLELVLETEKFADSGNPDDLSKMIESHQEIMGEMYGKN